MHRFYCPAPDSEGDQILLTGGEAHHAAHVLRLRPREIVTVLDGAGGELICELLEVNRKQVQLAVKERKSVPPPSCSITLFQAIPKAKLFEFIIQKATESGASRIVPLFTERVVMRLTEEDAAEKADKWQHVAIEAIKQCGSAWLPKVEAPVALREFLAHGKPRPSKSETHRKLETEKAPTPSFSHPMGEGVRGTGEAPHHGEFDLPLIASLQPGSRHAREYFRQYQEAHGRKPNSACIWIGPEGDFTPEEVSAIEAAGAKPITLGKLVLRSDTAALYCLSILNYELSATD